MLTILTSLQAMSFGDLLIAVVVIAACCAIVCVALKKFEISPPEWAVKIFWIIVVACCAIMAIRLVLSM